MQQINAVNNETSNNTRIITR